MPDLKYSISLDLGSRIDLTKMVYGQAMPLVSQAVNAIGQQTRNNWMEAVYKAKLWSGEKDAYAQSITWNFTPGAMSGYVEATYKYAQEIETGRPAKDLKKMLNTSLKVRRTEKGKRFLVIPFRHNLASMPSSVRALATGMEQSKVTGAGLRPSGQVTHLSPKSGMSPSPMQTPFLSNPKTRQASMTAKMSYAWNDRLSKSALLQAGATKAEARKYAGMVRMSGNTPGGSKSSQYMNFRVMMEGSSGWIVPAQPGQYIAQKVQQEMQPKAETVFAEAMKRTVKP